MWDIDLPGWSNLVCTLVSCPTGSSGTVAGASGRDGESGCVVDAGYSGKATRLDAKPWVASTIAVVTWYVPKFSLLFLVGGGND